MVVSSLSYCVATEAALSSGFPWCDMPRDNMLYLIFLSNVEIHLEICFNSSRDQNHDSVACLSHVALGLQHPSRHILKALSWLLSEVRFLPLKSGGVATLPNGNYPWLESTGDIFNCSV